jgi:hypothetical protein
VVNEWLPRLRSRRNDILSINVLFAIAQRTSDERFKDFAERGAETLLKLAPQFDAPDCIKYALKQTDGCHPDYVAYEAVLFDDLAQWTSDNRFKICPLGFTRNLSLKWKPRWSVRLARVAPISGRLGWATSEKRPSNARELGRGERTARSERSSRTGWDGERR